MPEVITVPDIEVSRGNSPDHNRPAWHCPFFLLVSSGCFLSRLFSSSSILILASSLWIRALYEDASAYARRWMTHEGAPSL
jgi:hypothetical protein